MGNELYFKAFDPLCGAKSRDSFQSLSLAFHRWKILSALASGITHSLGEAQ